jgi:Fe-S-cluster containining protein
MATKTSKTKTTKSKPAPRAKKLKYDCLKCPGYCCSYPVIEVKDRDAARIAKHFGLPLKSAEKRYFKAVKGYKRVMRRKADQHFGKICQFFDTDARRCTIYEARPSTCREFPGEDNCGYWDFLAFERETQEDETFISGTWNIEN